MPIGSFDSFIEMTSILRRVWRALSDIMLYSDSATKIYIL
jgi:hypothetical protein